MAVGDKAAKTGLFSGGIHIQTCCTVLIIVSALLSALVVGSAFEVSKRYDDLRVITSNYIECADAAEQALSASDLLTSESRAFVEDGDTSHVDAFFEEVNVTRTRDNAYQTLRANNANGEAIQKLDSSVQASNELVQTEIRAMELKLAATGRSDFSTVNSGFVGYELSSDDAALSAKKQAALAASLLNGVDYVSAKQQITSDVMSTLSLLLAEVTENEAAAGEQLSYALTVQRIAVVLLLLACAVVFAVVLVLVVNPLRAQIERITRDERLVETGAYELRYLAKTYNRSYDEKAAKREELQMLAERDPLTQVLNRRAFNAAQDSYVGSPVPVCLLIIDVDNFKDVNDTFGHVVGDEVLRVVAEVLADSFRTGDYVARTGGDEFAILAPGARIENAEGITSKVAVVNELLGSQERGDFPRVTLSIGIAFSEHGFYPGLVEQADEALYAAKDAGRNCFRIYGM